MSKFFMGFLIAMGAILIFVVLFTLPTYFLWNWLMPDIFGLKTITLGQAAGLTLLCSCLFKSSNSPSKND